MAPDLTALTNDNLRLKVPDWRLWAYTGGSCLSYKSQQHVGAEVFIPAIKTAIYINSGGVGISNTINRAELTGIASALRAMCTHIATDSACSLSQIRKQLLFPELHRKHTHRELLEQIVSMINESNTPINVYKVKAHIGVIGNEFADAIAKHAFLHNYGHDEAFPPPSPDGNPFAHIYWLAEENKETTQSTTSLAPLQNINKLKAHMNKHHRLGDANTNSGYYNYWKRLLTFVNLTNNNSVWNNTRIDVSQKRDVIKFRTGVTPRDCCIQIRLAAWP